MVLVLLMSPLWGSSERRIPVWAAQCSGAFTGQQLANALYGLQSMGDSPAVRALVAAGYCLTAVELFDLFPQTSHVETVVKLERSS